jgi:bifunctional non-homologous end joining protein LigD
MLHFNLHGERLKGGWALVRLPRRGNEKRDNWLLIKERDEAADDSDPLLEEYTNSVSTGRTMEETSGTRTARAAEARKRAPARAGKSPRT